MPQRWTTEHPLLRNYWKVRGLLSFRIDRTLRTQQRCVLQGTKKKISRDLSHFSETAVAREKSSGDLTSLFGSWKQGKIVVVTDQLSKLYKQGENGGRDLTHLSEAVECGEGGAGGKDSPPIRVGVCFFCSALSLHTEKCTASVQRNVNNEVGESSSVVHTQPPCKPLTNFLSFLLLN